MTAYDIEANYAIALVIQTHDPLFFKSITSWCKINYCEGFYIIPASPYLHNIIALPDIHIQINMSYWVLYD